MTNTNAKILTAIILITSELAAGCSSDGDDNVEARSSVDWTQCHSGELECGSLSVPIDYSETDGDSIDLALIRPVSYTHLTLPTTPYV